MNSNQNFGKPTNQQPNSEQPKTLGASIHNGVHEIAEQTKQGAENLSNRATIGTNNLSNQAKVGADNLLDKTKVATDSFLDSAKHSTESLVDKAKISASALIDSTKNSTESLIDKSHAVVDRASDSTKAAADSFMERGAAMIDKLSERTSGAREAIGAGVEKIETKVGDAATVVADKLEQGQETAKELLDELLARSSEFSKRVTSYVEANPGKSVIAAVGIGYFAACILRGSRR